MRVYKYKLDVDGNPSVYNVPLVQPLKILMQNGVPVLWQVGNRRKPSPAMKTQCSQKLINLKIIK